MTINQQNKKAVYYIRESTAEQDKGFSPENQERVIKQYAQRENMEIVGDYKDLISGTSTKNRDGFLQMMEDAEKKIFDVILVYHTSRFARNISDARKNKEYLRERLNVDVISVTQSFGDWRDPSAFLNEGINELFDAHYSKQLSHWVRASLLEKRRQGKPVGNPPFGYYKKKLGFDQTRDRTLYEDKWRINPKESEIVKEIFTLYATGVKSFSNIAYEINKTGIKTKNNNPFTYSSIKDILKNKAYIGLIASPRKGYPELKGNHKAIITDDLFEQVQEVVEERRNTTGRPVAQHRFYLLQGIIYCNKCKKLLTKKNADNPNAKLLPKMYCEKNSGKSKDKEKLLYSCKIRREYKGCKQPSVICSTIDKKIINFMAGFKLPEPTIQDVIDKLRGLFESSQNNNSLQAEADFLNKKRKRINKMYSLGELPDDKYADEIYQIKQKLAHLKKQGFDGLNGKQLINERLDKTEAFLRSFARFWTDKLEPEEQRNWMLMLIKRIWVDGEEVVGIEPHEEFQDLAIFQQKVLGQAP